MKTFLTVVLESLKDMTQPDVVDLFHSLDRSSDFPENVLMQGWMVELEHAATVGGDVELIAGIVLDHLTEDPEYYTKLATMEKPQK